MTDPSPEVVIVVTPAGVCSVHFSADSYGQERSAIDMYNRIRPHIDAIDAALGRSR